MKSTDLVRGERKPKPKNDGFLDLVCLLFCSVLLFIVGALADENEDGLCLLLSDPAFMCCGDDCGLLLLSPPPLLLLLVVGESNRLSEDDEEPKLLLGAVAFFVRRRAILIFV